MSKSRYITFDVTGLDVDGDTVAFHETERWQTFMEMGEWHEYVWQYAENHEHAIQQHDVKWIQWRDDVNAGRQPRDTY